MCFWSWAESGLSVCSSFAALLTWISLCCGKRPSLASRLCWALLLSLNFVLEVQLCFTLVVETFEILTAWSSRSSPVLWNLRISVARNSPHQCIARLFYKKRKKRNKCENSTFYPRLKAPLLRFEWKKKQCNQLLSTCYDNCHSLPSVWTTQLSSLV